AKVGVDVREPNPPQIKQKNTYTYRGDSREPWEIFDVGFEPLGFSTDLFLHAKDNRSPPSIYVSTTTSKSEAIKFATGFGLESGYVYVLKNVVGIDVNKKLGLLSPHRKEVEIAVPGGVDKRDIVGATPVHADGSYVGYSIPNFDR
ncbi:enterotoxin A family protein, partial [Pseudomonas mediterranea]